MDNTYLVSDLLQISVKEDYNLYGTPDSISENFSVSRVVTCFLWSLDIILATEY